MKEEKEETKYNPDFLQIFRKVETRLTVNGDTGSITEERIVDSKPKADKYSSAELRKEAADYMAWEFGKEKIVKNKFTETVCTTKIEITKYYQRRRPGNIKCGLTVDLEHGGISLVGTLWETACLQAFLKMAMMEILRAMYLLERMGCLTNLEIIKW